MPYDNAIRATEVERAKKNQKVALRELTLDLGRLRKLQNDAPDECLLIIYFLEDLQELKCILDIQVVFLLFLAFPIHDSRLPEKEPR